MKQKKAWRVVKEVIDEADIVIEVVDARDPSGTRNKKVERLIRERGKKLLIVLNKADLVPKSWAEEYRERNRGIPMVFISAREHKGTGILRREIKKLANQLQKGEGEKVKIALIGYPNVGKSTIINVLKGKKSVKTAPVPGYTKGKQLIKLSKRLWLIDSPGILPIEDFDELVIKGGFPADKIDNPISPALKLIKRIWKTRKEALIDRYGIEEFEDEEEILEAIGKRKGIIRKGGEVDLEETARYFLREWQTGKLTLFGMNSTKKDEVLHDYEDVLDAVERELLLDPRRIIWRFKEELEPGRVKKVGIREVDEFIVGIATGFKKCPSAVKFLEELTGKKVISTECFGGKWKGVVAILG